MSDMGYSRLALAATLLQSLIVGLCSVFVVHIAHTHFNTVRGWTFCGLTLLTVWLFLACCWQQNRLEEAPANFTAAQEQPEGVWPPAPLTVQESKKDQKSKKDMETR